MLTFMADMCMNADIQFSCLLPICWSCPFIHSRYSQQIPITFLKQEINWFQYVCLRQGINRRGVMKVDEDAPLGNGTRGEMACFPVAS